MDEDTKEGSGLFVGVRLKLRLDLGDECGCYRGEQSSLVLRLARIHWISLLTHKYQSCTQIFAVLLHELLVEFFGLLVVVLVK
jgi:hypothetical protein